MVEVEAVDKVDIKQTTEEMARSLDQEIHDLALVAWREARGENSIEALRAVMHVVLNRAKAWGQSLHKVIYAPNQFTSMQDEQRNKYPKPGDLVWETCMLLALQVTNKEFPDPDPTGGALYYRNAVTATSKWFQDKVESGEWEKTVQIVNHEFWREV